MSEKSVPGSSIDEQMLNLQAGDVITNLSGLYGATTDWVNVLATINTWLILSKRSKQGELSYDTDLTGPYRWDSKAMALIDWKGLIQHPHIGHLSLVLKGVSLQNKGKKRVEKIKLCCVK